MNNPENLNPAKGKAGVKNPYISAEQLVAKMKVAFTNAKLIYKC